MSAFSSSPETPTYVVELTPVGRGAVAVLLVEGADAVRFVDECFVGRSGRAIACIPIDRIVFGNWGDAAGEELVICRRGAERVEVHCHGGVAAIQAIIASLLQKGCVETAWREWYRRSSNDPIQTEARIALANATTLRTAAVLLDQMNGALAAKVQAALAAVAADDWSGAVEIVSQLLANREFGSHLTAPWRVVLAGPPNVGKSSLINALAGYERAIVSPTAGTTRDVVTVATAIDGWPVELADTAGLRTSADELESAGVRLAQQMLAAADLVVLVNDVTQQALTMDDSLFSSIRTSRIIQVCNKVDLLSDPELRPSADHYVTSNGDAIYVSAATGQGVSELVAAISQTLVQAPPAAGAALPFLPQHVESLVIARDAIERRQAAEAVEQLQSLLALAN